MCLKKFRALLSIIIPKESYVKLVSSLSRIRKALTAIIRRDTGKQIDEITAEVHKRIMDEVSDIEKLTHDIVDSRTYLIYPKKAILLSKIETVKQEVAKSKKSGILDSDFLGEMGRTLNNSFQLVSAYNDNFVSKEKLITSICGQKARFLLMMSNKQQLLPMTSTILWLQPLVQAKLKCS
jgi:hypothetical protein